MDDNNTSDPTMRDILLENARGPKKVQGDAGTVEQHSLREQIELDRYLASKKAAGGLGIIMRKMKPDGTV